MASLQLNQDEIHDGVEAGIQSLTFGLTPHDDDVFSFGCGMWPDDSVQDASESDFPAFDCHLKKAQVLRLIAMLTDGLGEC